jgi:single-strand DNA-binding protein
LFLRASVWDEFARHVSASLTNGMRVTGTGRLKQRSYETKEGEKRSSIDLVVDSIGPDLRYATAQVTRRTTSGAEGNDVEPTESWPVAPIGQDGGTR